MNKRYALLNHDTGMFETCYEKSVASAVVKGWMEQGTDIEDITVVFGTEVEKLAVYSSELKSIVLK